MALRARSRRLATLERSEAPDAPWQALNRRQQQQLLARLVIASPESEETPTFAAPDIQEWFGIARRTAHRWIHSWHEEGLIEPASAGGRVTAWRVRTGYITMVHAVRRAIVDEK